MERTIEETNDIFDASGINIYTFIIYEEINKNQKKRPSVGTPNFIEFNHSDHCHILYSCYEPNKKRHFERICNYLNATPNQHTSANITLIRIVGTVERFVMYLLRKGLNTWKKYGTGVENLGKIWDKMKFLFADKSVNENEIDGSTNCVQYINEKLKDRENEKFTNKYAQYIKEFLPTIENNNIGDITEFKRLATKEKLLEHYSRLGKSWESKVQTLIDYEK